MDKGELQRILGPLRFGDAEQIRIKNLASDGEGAEVSERLQAFLEDALRKLGDVPPEALARWAQGLPADARQEARRKVAALREVILAMDVFLEKAPPPAEPAGR